MLVCDMWKLLRVVKKLLIRTKSKRYLLSTEGGYGL